MGAKTALISSRDEQRGKAGQVRDRPVAKVDRIVPAARIERKPDSRDRVEPESRSNSRQTAAHERGTHAVASLQDAAVQETERDPQAREQHEQSGIADERLEQVEASGSRETDRRAADRAGDRLARGRA